MHIWDLEKGAATYYELHIRNATVLGFMWFGSEGLENQAHILDSEQSTFVFIVFLYNKIHSVNTIPDKSTEVIFSTLGVQSSKKYIQFIDG